MLRIIRETQPKYVVGENVSGVVSWNGGMVFEEVQAEMEAEGYEVQPFVLPACAVNAPHRRDRVWFVAHRISEPSERKCGKIGNEGREANNSESTGIRQDNGQTCPGRIDAIGASRFTTNTSGKQRAERIIIDGDRQNETKEGARVDNRTSRHGIDRNAPDTSNKGLQGSKIIGSIGGSRAQSNKFSAGRILSTWEEFPTQSPICSRNDGLPSRLAGITFSKHRNESIKAYGNAIVPQVAIQIFRAIIETEARLK